MKLKGKIIIKGQIIALTGLHIGGNKSSLEIGGVDLNVVKTGSGKPYIPGSSLKGKMRSLLGKVRGKENVTEDTPLIKSLFGDAGGRDQKQRNITRLQVRDAILDEKGFDAAFGKKEQRDMDFEFSEIKTENVINRTNGKAEHPRQVERVPAGAKFNFNLVVDLYDTDNATEFLKLIAEGFELLQYDYLGGHGSRGSGEVRISGVQVSGKDISEKDGITEMKERPWGNLFAGFTEAHA